MVIREVFIHKDRDTTASFSEDFRDLIEKFVARIEYLVAFILGVVTMFDDQQNGIDIEPLLFAERLRNGLAKFNPMLVTGAGAQIPFRLLMIPHADQFKRRLMVKAIPGVAVNKASRDVVGMGTKSVYAVDGGDTRFSFGNRVSRAAFRFPLATPCPACGGNSGC